MSRFLYFQTPENDEEFLILSKTVDFSFLSCFWTFQCILRSVENRVIHQRNSYRFLNTIPYADLLPLESVAHQTFRDVFSTKIFEILKNLSMENIFPWRNYDFSAHPTSRHVFNEHQKWFERSPHETICLCVGDPKISIIAFYIQLLFQIIEFESVKTENHQQCFLKNIF